MKAFVVLAVLSVVCLLQVTAEESYPTRYDNIDIDAVIRNKPLFDNYVACLLKKGKCNQEGTLLRDIVPDALTTGCTKCNDKQRVSARKVIEYLRSNRKNDWNLLLNEYDPNREYETKYQHLLEN